MPAKRKTNEQLTKLKQLSEIHTGYIVAKAEMRALIEAEFETRLRDWELKESRAMNEAKRLGIPQTDIGRAVGTSNWDTLKAKYALTAFDFVESTLSMSWEIHGHEPFSDGVSKGTVTVTNWDDNGEILPLVVEWNYFIVGANQAGLGNYPDSVQMIRDNIVSTQDSARLAFFDAKVAEIEQAIARHNGIG